MKKWRPAVFAAAFLVAYLSLCFGIPGWRLMLAAEPAEYILAHLRHMALLKSILAAAIAAIAERSIAWARKS